MTATTETQAASGGRDSFASRGDESGWLQEGYDSQAHVAGAFFICDRCVRVQDLLSWRLFYLLGTGRWYEDCWISVIKGGGPWVHSCVTERISWMSFFMDLAGLSCSKRIHRQTPQDTPCLEIAGSNGIRSGAPMFLSSRLVSKGALRRSAGCYHHLTWFLVPWWSQIAENVMNVKFCGLAIVVQAGNVFSQP
jgi:hypothetical protein